MILYFVGFCVSLWPRASSHKFALFLKEQGIESGPNPSIRKMRELAPSLYKRYLIGIILTIIFMIPLVAAIIVIVIPMVISAMNPQ